MTQNIFVNGCIEYGQSYILSYGKSLIQCNCQIKKLPFYIINEN